MGHCCHECGGDSTALLVDGFCSTACKDLWYRAIRHLQLENAASCGVFDERVLVAGRLEKCPLNYDLRKLFFRENL